VVDGWLAMAAKAVLRLRSPPRCHCFDGVTVLAPGVGQAMPADPLSEDMRGRARDCAA